MEFYGNVFKSVSNIFGGIKDIKIFKRDTLFVENFIKSKKIMRKLASLRIYKEITQNNFRGICDILYSRFNK